MFKTASLYLALAIFGGGLLFKISTWFRYRIGSAAREIALSTRLTAAFRGVAGTLFSRRIVTLLKVLVLDVFFQIRLLRQDFLRWLMHILLYGGFMALLLVHALSKYTTAVLFPGYYPTLNPWLCLRDCFAAVMFAGLAIAAYRRFLRKGRRPPTSAMDRYAMLILALILVSGVLLEATRMVSHSIYLEMVEEYAGPQDEATLRALEAYWVEDFALVAPGVQAPFDAATLQQGKAFHQTACIDCHARPQWAFLSYGLARVGKPLAAPLERADARTLLYYLHFLACCGGLAYLPFSKLFHMFASPLSLMLNAVMEKGRSAPANIATRQIIELDACMHCGSCTLRCAVAVAFEEIPNVNILPSEKIASIKALAAGRKLSIDQLRIIQQGMALCTNCYRCTLACPAGINLQDLWFSVRETLQQHVLPEMIVLSPISLLRGLMQDSSDLSSYAQPVEQARDAINAACHLEQLRDRTAPMEPEGARLLGNLTVALRSQTLSSCYRCMTCSQACPVVRNTPNAMEALGLLPHQIMHAAGLRLWDLVFTSNMLWDCLGCYQCQEHCPMNVRITDILYELKNLAIEQVNEDLLKQLRGKR